MKPFRNHFFALLDTRAWMSKSWALHFNESWIKSNQKTLKQLMSVLWIRHPCTYSRLYDLRVALYLEQSKLHMDGFRSLKEGEPVEFIFKKSSKGLESLRVTGPGGAPCSGSEKRPKGAQKRRSKGDRYVLMGWIDDKTWIVTIWKMNDFHLHVP